MDEMQSVFGLRYLFRIIKVVVIHFSVEYTIGLVEGTDVHLTINLRSRTQLTFQQGGGAG